jgi:hypothetical protein
MRLTGDTAEASIDMRGRLFRIEVAFQYLFHQHDASAWRVRFVTEHLVSRTGWQTEAAMNAGFNSMPHRRATRPKLFDRNSVKHTNALKVKANREASKSLGTTGEPVLWIDGLFNASRHRWARTDTDAITHDVPAEHRTAQSMMSKAFVKLLDGALARPSDPCDVARSAISARDAHFTQ